MRGLVLEPENHASVVWESRLRMFSFSRRVLATILAVLVSAYVLLVGFPVADTFVLNAV